MTNPLGICLVRLLFYIIYETHLKCFVFYFCKFYFIGMVVQDRNGFPTLVSGVPPDAFSETGQLWGR